MNKELNHRLVGHQRAFNDLHIYQVGEAQQGLLISLEELNERIDLFKTDNTVGYSEFYKTECVDFIKTVKVLEKAISDLELIKLELVKKQIALEECG